jgi:hypothetical protein
MMIETLRSVVESLCPCVRCEVYRRDRELPEEGQQRILAWYSPCRFPSIASIPRNQLMPFISSITKRTFEDEDIPAYNPIR